MKWIRVSFTSLYLIVGGASVVNADLITFEVVPPGSIININPYTELGFSITASHSAYAIFDADARVAMPGNPTDWYGFAETTEITVSAVDSSLFTLSSLLTGPASSGSGTVVMTILGSHLGGGLSVLTTPSLSTATTIDLGWTNLTSFRITGTDAAGLDNIDVAPVPEPASLSFLAIGLAGLGASRWRKRKRQ